MGATTAKRTFKIVDLIRKRDRFEFVEVPKYPVEMTIEVTTTSKLGTPKPAPSAVLDRLEGVARAKLDEYETIITDEVMKLEGKIRPLMQQPGSEALKQAEQMTQTTSVMVKKALESAQAAAETAVDARLAKEKQNDSLLTEARIKTVIKIGSGVISVSSSVAKLVATSGAEVSSYFSIAKSLYEIASEIRQQLKGEETLRKDLKAGVNAFLDLRGTMIMQAATRQQLTNLSGIPRHPGQAIQFIVKRVTDAGNELTKGRSAGDIARDVKDFVVKGIKGKINDAEAARVAYRNHTTKMRHKVDSASAKADELARAMKGATNLRNGVAIGSKCMALKTNVRNLAVALSSAETFLDEMQQIMAGGGLEIDDSTVIQKLKRLDIPTIFEEGKGVFDAAKEIYELVGNVADAVA